MTPAAFKRLCADIRLKWMPGSGLVALLRGPALASVELRLCASPSVNTGVMAENCVVWNGDDRVYKGGIEAEELKQLLTRHRICRAVYTTSKSMGSMRRPDWSCLGNALKCDGVRCPVRQKMLKQLAENNAERVSVQGAEDGVRKRPDRE